MNTPCAACGRRGIHHATLDGRHVKLCTPCHWSAEGNPALPTYVHVIRVEDLEAALEARHRGGVTVEHVGEAMRSPFVVGVFEDRSIDARIRAKGAAHLARVALGEVSP